MRRRQCRPGPRTTGLVWMGCLLLVSLVSLPVGGQVAPEEDPPEALPLPPASRDTTGQAELRWQVDRPVRQASLLTADRTVYRVIDDEAISFYYGNVYLDRDSVVVRADSAHVFRGRSVVRLFDHVHIRHNETRIASDWAEYRRDDGEADLRGRVRVVEDQSLVTGNLGELRHELQLLRVFDDAVFIAPEYTVRADTLVRDRRLGHGEAFGNVRIMDPDGGSLVTGDHGLFSADGTWAQVDENPALETREEGGDPVHSIARNMKFYRAEERVVMTDSVHIYQGPMQAFADTAISYGKERMVLRGKPRLEQGERSRMYGDQIEFFYRDGALYRVILLGQARMEDTEPDSLAAIYRGLPEFDVIEGDSITVHFRRGQIRRTDVVGNAHSIYVPVDVEKEISYNEVAGDTLVLRFADSRVREVEVRGNMTGTYHFASIAAMRGPEPAALDSAAVDSLIAVADSLAAVGDTLAADVIVERLAAARGDTVVAAPDSLAAATVDTLDFTGHAQPVDYSGHSVLFDLPGRTIAISEDATLVYESMNLSARDVILDTENRELYADGDPILQDSETIVGKQMGYDFGSKTGAVRVGITSFDGYYYAGEEIHRFPDGSLKINSGHMTSCDLEQPHYHFWGKKMKMRLGDRVVAAPIVMKVGRVPVFALPFYFKSLKEGRRSGILFPNFNFGTSSREGRYIRDLGYFWATNDYTDFTFEIDYNERRQLAWRVRNRYQKRYSFSGNFEYNQLQQLQDDAATGDEWQFRWNHNQPELFDDYKFRVEVEMASTELSRNDLGRDTGRDVVKNELKSTAYISRSFRWGGGSLNASRTERVNAADDGPPTANPLYNMTLPSLSLSLKQISLAPELGRGETGGFLGNVGRSTTFSQNYSASNIQSATEETSTRVNAMSGSWGLNFRPSRLGIFNWNLGARSSWRWDRKEVAGRAYIPADVDTLPGEWEDISDVTETSKPSLSFSTGLSTTLYGVFPVAVGPLEAIRHTFNASASTSYTPHLGSKQSKSNTYTFSVDNRFDIKYLGEADSDTTRAVKKLDGLLDWGLNTRFNPDGDERKWSNVGSTMTFKPGASRNLAFRLTNTIDPYLWKVLDSRLAYGFGFSGRFDTGYEGQARDEEASGAIGRLGAMEPDSLALARADSLADDLEMRAEFGDNPDGPYGGNYAALGDRTGNGRQERDDTDGGRFIPWQLGGSFSLTHNAPSASSPDGLFTARANINVNTQLTRDWSFRYQAAFDLSEGTISRQEYRLQRDLHCWRLEFTRIVNTNNSEFGFRFYLMAIPELKLTRGKDDLLGSAQGANSLF